MGTPGLPQAIQLPQGNLELLHEYILSSGERIQGVKQGAFSVLDSEGATHGGALDGNGFTAVTSVPMGMAEIEYGKDPSDPWDESSYFGKLSWPPKPVGADPAGGPSTGASALSSLGSALPAASQGASAIAALGDSALSSVAAATSLAGSIPGASAAASAVGQLAGAASTAQQALGVVQSVQQGGAQALLGPAAQLAQSKAIPAIAQQVQGALPPGFAGNLNSAMSDLNKVQQPPVGLDVPKGFVA